MSLKYKILRLVELKTTLTELQRKHDEDAEKYGLIPAAHQSKWSYEISDLEKEVNEIEI